MAGPGDKKKLLFVCSGNSCRSPMAMVVAGSIDGARAITDSAAGNYVDGHFKASKKTAINAINAIKAQYGEGSSEYTRISSYVPKPLSLQLVEWADLVLFLGEEFRANAIKAFPQYQSKMMLYCMYPSKKTGALMHEVPDPFDGDHWADYFGPSVRWPGKMLASYSDVLKAMITDFEPALDSKIWPKK